MISKMQESVYEKAKKEHAFEVYVGSPSFNEE